MTRTTISGNVPAEIAERMSDTSVDVTDASIDEAVTAIIEDYLILGLTYPRKGRNRLSAGDIVQEYASEEEQADMLSALVYGCGEPLEQQNALAERLVKTRGPEYLREHRYDLIEDMLDELRGEE